MPQNIVVSRSLAWQQIFNTSVFREPTYIPRCPWHPENLSYIVLSFRTFLCVIHQRCLRGPDFVRMRGRIKRITPLDSDDETGATSTEGRTAAAVRSLWGSLDDSASSRPFCPSFRLSSLSVRHSAPLRTLTRWHSHADNQAHV